LKLLDKDLLENVAMGNERPGIDLIVKPDRKKTESVPLELKSNKLSLHKASPHPNE